MVERSMSTSPLPDQSGLRPNRACRACVKIKAKCIPLAGAERSTCERCSRLGKECTTPAPVPRRGHGSRIGGSSRRLEDDASSASTSSRTLQESSRSQPEDYRSSTFPRCPAALPPEITQPVTPASMSHPSLTPSSTVNSTGQLFNPTAESTIHPGGTLPSSVNGLEYFQKVRTSTTGSAFDISPEIGHAFTPSIHEKLFDQFRMRMSPHFPFVALKHEPAAMRIERPFTYVACVMAAAHRDATFQYRVSRDMLRYVGEHMLLSGEKSLDLLQGFLIMITWYHVYTHGNPQLMNMVHLAKALLVDLGLNRPPGTGLFSIKLSNDGIKMMHGIQLDSHKHTLEEQRACLALYHVCFKLSSCFRRLDPMYWTEHLEECCRSLQDAAEQPSDAFAVALVRLDRLVDRYTNIDGGRQTLTMPISTYIKLVSEDLEAFKQNLSPQLKGNRCMESPIHTARLCLYERVINSFAGASAHKVEALHSCLQGVLDFFDFLVAQPLENIPTLPFLFWSTIAHAFDVMAKLSFADVEDWDLDYVRNNPGFVAVTNRIVQKFTEVQMAEEAQHPLKPDTRFKIFIHRMEQFEKWYLSRLDLESKASMQRAEPESETPGTANDPILGSRLGDFADLLWQDLNPDWAGLDNSFDII